MGRKNDGVGSRFRLSQRGRWRDGEAQRAIETESKKKYSSVTGILCFGKAGSSPVVPIKQI